MPDNRRSKTVTQGVQRSPNRAMLRAVGFGDKDFVGWLAWPGKIACKHGCNTQ